MAHASNAQNNLLTCLTPKLNLHPYHCYAFYTIIVCRKGGAFSVTRKCYTHLHTIRLLEEYGWLQSEHNLFLCGAARVLSVPDSHLVK
jgi:hypothetical protein